MTTTETLLLKQPTVSTEQVAFLYASDIWIANRDGSNPRRLTVHKGLKSAPVFSPDGRQIAFSGNYDGNTCVYVIPTEGGSPERLTYHPGPDWVRGWTPDGQRVLFASSRDTPTSRHRRLYTDRLDGAFPESLPMPMAERGAYSPDGSQIVFHSNRTGRSQIWVMNADGSDPHLLVALDAECWDPVWIKGW